jgi:pimeloyl-ACP methyl ester carboxylesterase
MVQRLPPRAQGFVSRRGVRVHYQVFGQGRRAVLLLPTWAIVHSDFWSNQVPHLCSRYTVLAYDGRGNGGSDRPTDPAAYDDYDCAADALAVMDEAGVHEAAAISLSGGAVYGLLLATQSPERFPASVFIAPGLPITPGYPERTAAQAVFDEPQPRYEGWGKWNRNYWLEDWEGFLAFFSGRCFSEPDSTDAIRHWVQMGLETTPEAVLATVDAPGPGPDEVRRAIRTLHPPLLVVHGADDQVIPLARSEELARLTGAELAVIPGAGHEPQYRHPERFNAILDGFLDTHYPRD